MVVYVIIGWIGSAFLCAYIASEKNRDSGGWFVAGLLFGVFAVIAIVAVPSLSKEERKQRERDAKRMTIEEQIALTAKQEKQHMGPSFFDPVQRPIRERSAHEEDDKRDV
jgi:hypothetical protein